MISYVYGDAVQDEDSDAQRSKDDLLKELVRRSDIDQAARSALQVGDQEGVARLMQIDDDNATWLTTVVDAVGWPGRSLVGNEGAHAAWLLAQHADRHPTLQRRCLRLLQEAVAQGEASPSDLAHLTDRVLLASHKPQIYGTQITARDGRFVPCRLRDPETVDARRAAVGLGTLEAHLGRALEHYGPPKPSHMPCPSCHTQVELWPPEIGGRSRVKCPSCGLVATVYTTMRVEQPLALRPR